MPDLDRKLDVLRAHCEHEGRAYDDIEKTVLYRVGFEEKSTDEMLKDLRRFADLGFSEVHCTVAGAHTLTPLQRLGAEVIPQIADW